MVEARLAWLLRAQNADGGWGYGQGKASWLEPTVYAMRALSAWTAPGRPADAYQRAQRYVDGLQQPGGGWQASRQVPELHWSGALWLGLEAAPRDSPARWSSGLCWLISQRGAEGGWARRLAFWLDPHAVEQDPTLRGWPWLDGTNSWVEPTCHAVLALTRAQRLDVSRALARRLDEGRRVLWDRRCSDGGWNYGNRRVRGLDLPGYPRTTALALLALKRSGGPSLPSDVPLLQQYWQDASIGGAERVWLALALREHGIPVTLEGSTTLTDTMTVALELVAWSPGGYA